MTSWTQRDLFLLYSHCTWATLCPAPRSAGAWDRDLAHASRKAATRTFTPYPMHSSPCRLGNGALFDLITHPQSLILFPPAPSSRHPTTYTAQQPVIWGPRALISGCSCVTWDGNDGEPKVTHNGRLLWVVLPQLYLLTGTAIVSGSWRQKQKLENILKMAASGKVIESPRKLNLRPLGVESDTERGHRFWNRNVVEMKFSIEHDWMKRVCFAESKPNYGMRELDPVLEELMRNKLELIGPMLDGFIIEIRL